MTACDAVDPTAAPPREADHDPDPLPTADAFTASWQGINHLALVTADMDATAAGVLAAFSAPGVLEGTRPMPWRDTPAAFALNLILADQVAHSWDLARATGLTIEIPTATAEIALATTQASVTPEFRAAGLYAAEQPAPEDASTLDRLAAFTGRSL